MLKLPKAIVGYTLIEILVGITIIGFIFSTGFVSFREFSRRQALQSATKNIKGDLRFAQEQALSGKKPVSAFCTPPRILHGYYFRVTSATTYEIEAYCSGGNVDTKLVTIPLGITITTPSPNPLLFKSIGQGTNITSGGNINMTVRDTASGATAPITVSYTGEIR